MSFFCIFDHPQMPLVRVSVEKSSKTIDKFGFRQRYVLEIPEDQSSHADDVIGMIDDAMGKATKGHGIYQAKYEAVRAAYGAILESAGHTTEHPLLPATRAAALVLGVALAVANAFVMPAVIFGFLLFTAIRRQSAFAAMFEAEIVGRIFDWRPLIRRLLRYSKGKKS